MITPTGGPAWLRTASHTDYGGDVNKRNYQSQGAVNAQTDLVAEQLVSMAADLAGVVRTVPFATITYQNNDTAPANPTLLDYIAMHGNGAANAPTLTRNAEGDVTIQWAASYTDPYGVSGAVSIKHVVTNVAGQNAAIEAPWEIVDARTVRVRVKNTGGAAEGDDIVTVIVWTGPGA